MASYDYDIGIIGGGAAGLTVAAGAAQFGARTLLVEKSKGVLHLLFGLKGRACTPKP